MRKIMAKIPGTIVIVGTVFLLPQVHSVAGVGLVILSLIVGVYLLTLPESPP